MKNVGMLLFLTLLPIGRSSGEGIGNGQSSRPIPDSIREELVKLGAEDQELRHDLSPEQMQDTVLMRRMMQGDSARTARLQKIVDEYGWPDSARAGAAASKAAFLVLQHSPSREFQKNLLPVIEELAGKGLIPPGQTAMLIDRVLADDELPQRYGTQFGMVDGKLVLHPVDDEGNLEARRKAMGLPTMDEYVRQLEKVYNTEVVR